MKTTSSHAPSQGSGATLQVGVLVFPDCVRSAAVVPLDVLATAQALLQARPGARPLQLQGRWVAAGRARLVQAQGLGFATSQAEAGALDALVVPGVAHADADDLLARVEALAAEQALLRRLQAAGVPLLLGCSAVVLGASAGVLDGRRATTSWWLADTCRRRFAAVDWCLSESLVEDGPLVTAAGVTSYFDLALHLVGRSAGDDLRQLAARLLLHEQARPSQAPYLAAAPAHPAGPVVIERARLWLGRRLAAPWTLQALARHCRTSERTLLRRFKAVLGVTPVQYVQQLRVERAKTLLSTTLLSLPEIAHRCGYQDASTLHKVFRQWVQMTPAAYRQRFGLRA